MDGLDKLIEMFERRFGKLWGDLLLLIFVLGAAAWAIHSVVENVVSPVVPYGVALFNYASGMNIIVSNRSFTFEDILAAVVTVVLLLGSGYASYRAGFTSGLYRRRSEHLLSIAQNQTLRIEELERELRDAQAPQGSGPENTAIIKEKPAVASGPLR